MINEKLRSSLGLEDASTDELRNLDINALSLAISNEMAQLDTFSSEIDKEIATVDSLVEDYVSLENLYNTAVSLESTDIQRNTLMVLNASLNNVGRKYGIVAEEDLGIGLESAGDNSPTISMEGVKDFMANIIKAIITKLKKIFKHAVAFAKKVNVTTTPISLKAKALYKKAIDNGAVKSDGNVIENPTFLSDFLDARGNMVSAAKYRDMSIDASMALASKLIQIDDNLYRNHAKYLDSLVESGNTADGGINIGVNILETEIKKWNSTFGKEKPKGSYRVNSDKEPKHDLTVISIADLPGDKFIGWGYVTPKFAIAAPTIVGGVMKPPKDGDTKFLDKIDPLDKSDILLLTGSIIKVSDRLGSTKSISSRKLDSLIKEIEKLDKKVSSGDSETNKFVKQVYSEAFKVILGLVKIRYNMYSNGFSYLNHLNRQALTYCEKSLSHYKES